MIVKGNIATILPYKENYTFSGAQAAALWVSEFFKNSRYKNFNYIYGNTNSKDFLTKNYINIPLKNKNKFQSTTNEYCNEFYKLTKDKNIDIIEIHNRPAVFINLKKKIKAKYILYFHNDPQKMKGSKSINERLWLLNNVDKLIFVSKWTQKKFFEGLDEKLINDSEIIYPSVNKIKHLPLKRNYITFVGKLNESKGYDIFKDAVLKILDKHKNWKAFSIGNEERRQIYINHSNHKELGFLSHKKVIDHLKKTKIAIVCSKWEEPFGRTALEASSLGCATIISNRGGLPETCKHKIILKNNNEIQLYKEINKLILNKNLRTQIQSKAFLDVPHTIEANTVKIDNIRDKLVHNFSLNYITNKMKIMNIYNIGQKLNHRLYNISIGKKFTNGFIRNGHDILDISDRDFIKSNRLFSTNTAKKKFQEYLIETFKNYNPDFLLFGHTNNIDYETISTFRNYKKNLIISQWNEDPIMKGLDYSKKNIANFSIYKDLVDHNFITTHPEILKSYGLNISNFHFFFVPVDKNIECFDVYKQNPNKDIFYAMSHGVNRAGLKKGKIDNRINFLNKLVKKISDVSYDFYGFENKDPIWGNNFNEALINSKMGLNLSRGKPTKYYSSNRIASLVGNGLLTFIDKKTQINEIFNNNEIIFYKDIDELADQIKFYKKKDNIRKKIAQKGKAKYFKLFNEKLTTKYILDISIGKQSKLF